MAYRRKAMPEVRATDPYDYQFKKLVREQLLEQQDALVQITTPVTPLPATATLTDVISKVNEIIARLSVG